MKTTQLGYPVVSDDIYRRIFGKSTRPVMGENRLNRTKRLLKEFDINVPVKYPDSLYDGDLPLPALEGKDIREHFETIATRQVGRFKALGDSYSRCILPAIPPANELVFQPGWTRYTWDGSWKTESVEYPLEDAFTFDTETFVQGGAFPIIGTALSQEAAYIWLAKELINPTIPVEEWDQFNFIPIGTERLVIGHNISYDRVRAQESYSLDRTKPENFYFDTLSAHIAVSGLASGQRFLFTLSAKDPKSLSEEDKRKLRYAPKWFQKGSTNSMVQVYNFHVCEQNSFFGDEGGYEPLKDSDKEVRDLFVKATGLIQITPHLREAVDYAIKDALYTARIFQALWPKYLDASPSMVALSGHYYLNGSIVPLVDNWKEWIEGTEEVYESYNNEMNDICKKLLEECYQTWKSFECDEDRRNWVNKDPWLKQLDWEVKSTKGKYANVPNWLRPFVKDPDTKVGVKSRLAHLLLKLTWEGEPIVWTKEDGWCYKGEVPSMRVVWVNDVYDDEFPEKGLKKIPHPKGTGDNVGSLFSKDFVEDMAVGRLNSELPEAKRALEIADATSYWTSVRNRVMDRLFSLAHNNYGEDAIVTVPEILCHGTVTRRTVEPLFATMCKTKKWRIGTELKTRVKAPQGWKIVGADFDGQEMQIASIYSDKWEGGFVGCSPFGHNVLSGSKEDGTDPHSSLAKIGGVDRDLAKVIGFSILYGAALKAVKTYIRRRYPEKSDMEVENFGRKMIEGKKGVKIDGVYVGGTDSGAFNYMEEIALNSTVSKLPCLGTKISTAMRKGCVGSDFKTGRVNWTIQSSGAEILSIILTSTHWLADVFKIPCRFVISIHDEVWFITPDKYAEQFAALFQMAHLYTWALFQYSVGVEDLPLSRAFFSSVAIDDRIRKTPDECTVSPSNSSGESEPPGLEYTMNQLAARGVFKKLESRLKCIEQGLI